MIPIKDTKRILSRLEVRSKKEKTMVQFLQKHLFVIEGPGEFMEETAFLEFFEVYKKIRKGYKWNLTFCLDCFAFCKRSKTLFSHKNVMSVSKLFGNYTLTTFDHFLENVEDFSHFNKSMLRKMRFITFLPGGKHKVKLPWFNFGPCVNSESPTEFSEAEKIEYVRREFKVIKKLFLTLKDYDWGQFPSQKQKEIDISKKTKNEINEQSIQPKTPEITEIPASKHLQFRTPPGNNKIRSLFSQKTQFDNFPKYSPFTPSKPLKYLNFRKRSPYKASDNSKDDFMNLIGRLEANSDESLLISEFMEDCVDHMETLEKKLELLKDEP